MPYHRLLFLVNNWTVWKGMAWAAQTARSHPPAMDMWAPNLGSRAARFRSARTAGSIVLLPPWVGRIPAETVTCGRRPFDPTMKTRHAKPRTWLGIRPWYG